MLWLVFASCFQHFLETCFKMFQGSRPDTFRVSYHGYHDITTGPPKTMAGETTPNTIPNRTISFTMCWLYTPITRIKGPYDNKLIYTQHINPIQYLAELYPILLVKVFSFSDLRQKTARFFAYHFMETSERQHFIRRRTWCNGGCLSWANTNGRLVQDPNPLDPILPNRNLGFVTGFF